MAYRAEVLQVAMQRAKVRREIDIGRSAFFAKSEIERFVTVDAVKIWQCTICDSQPSCQNCIQTASAPVESSRNLNQSCLSIFNRCLGPCVFV